MGDKRDTERTNYADIQRSLELITLRGGGLETKKGVSFLSRDRKLEKEKTSTMGAAAGFLTRKETGPPTLEKQDGKRETDR